MPDLTLAALALLHAAVQAAGPTMVLQKCYSGVTVVLQLCYNGVTVVLE
jgi:hypothetical protein